MYLYVNKGFRGGKDRREHTEKLVKTAVIMYAKEKGISLDGFSLEICRTEKGKPYFKEIPVEFSVSHTDDLWACLFSDRNDPVGLDIQQIKETRQDRIAERYFTDDEKEFLLQEGTDAFFTVWTRKEAFAKYTGEGITKELSVTSTLSNNEVYFETLNIRDDVKCSCCMKNKGDLCLRTI